MDNIKEEIKLVEAIPTNNTLLVEVETTKTIKTNMEVVAQEIERVDREA